MRAHQQVTRDVGLLRGLHRTAGNVGVDFDHEPLVGAA
jgi:hypothetical protein